MLPNLALQLAVLLKISILTQCQFEFNDLEAAHGMIVETVRLGEVKCISILRPTNENAKQKSAIDGLTYRLINEYSSEKYSNQRPSVMAYTTDMYEKLNMDINVRKRDNCVYRGTAIMVSDSTNAQLVRLSQSLYTFEQAFWVLFANQTEVDSLFQNVRLRVSTRFWIAQTAAVNGHFRLIEMGTLGNDIVPVGFILWAKDAGVLEISRGVQSNIAGLTVNVGTRHIPPYMAVNFNESGDITSVTGFYGDIWNDLQEALMFNSVYNTPNEGKDYELFKANRIGLIGMVVEKWADVLLGPMTISTTRNDILDFLHPIHKTKFKIFYKKEEDIHDWFKVFRPLAYTVWITLVIWILTGGSVVYFVSTVLKNFKQVNNDLSLINCIYFVLRTLCNQGLDQVPKPWALRIFLITAYLHATLIVTSYSASLTSVLTVKTPVEPFNTLPDILATDYKILITSYSPDYEFFAKAKDPIHREVYEKSVIKTRINHGGYLQPMETTCENQKTVFFGTFTGVAEVYHRSKLPCVLLPLRLEISPVYHTLATAKHSQYRELLNRCVFRMIEHGLVNRYRQFYLPNSYDTSEEYEIGIGLIDVGSVFIYLTAMQVLSIGFFIMELLSRKYQLNKKCVTSR